VTSKKVKVMDVLDDVDFMLCVVLEDDTLRFVGQGLKFRQNPLFPIGWRKWSTAEGYAKTLSQMPHLTNDWNVKEIQVCKRMSAFSCLSSYAILKQNQGGNDER